MDRLIELEQLRTTFGRIAELSASVEDFAAMPLRLTLTLLATAVDALSQELNRRNVAEIEFALNDLEAASRELSAEESAAIEAEIVTARSILARLGSATALPDGVTTKITVLQKKLLARRQAIERAPYRPPGTEAEPLPHDPVSLQTEARSLKEDLVAAGFDTPALDFLIHSPERFFLGQIRELLDELDVIKG